MHAILEDTADDLLAVRVEGKITRDDYRVLAEQIDTTVERHGSVRLLVEVGRLEGIAPGVFWEDLKITLKHYRHITRMAVVGEARWLERWVGVGNKLSPGVEVEHFDATRRGDALAWVADGDSHRRVYRPAAERTPTERPAG
ncbi:MAG TPA: STAS/SEC14 domain-containing protein [Thermoanaerobaculia bacterium]|nr:STAS/SEC14 domain-containing protein [Thermoanaerobaculia bacterium]